ncbi:O-antigen ligase family protein [Photobacterium damselae]|uniref:Uncharacterized protein n=1 Tax=Photobacterium damselae subsp. damselae TaxID=85581 RepID=A0AAD3ZW08_PHODD|nr:O-antigen ligase family protein [Photobacterium damselae]KAB1183219.1 hypothetical protein F6450_04640 [Photobacterium damselae subsp. damselae]
MVTFSFKKIIIIYVLIFLPICDMVNGYLVVNGILTSGGIGSPSQIGRLVAIILFSIYIFKERINIYWLGGALLLLLLFEIHGALYLQSVIGFIFGVTNSYKIFYLITSLVVFSKIIDNRYYLIYFIKTLKINLYIVSGSIIIAFVFGIGNSTYGWGSGTKGFFSSGNSLGIYIGSLAILYLSLYRYKLMKDYEFYLFLIIPISLLFLSSKTALLLSAIILLYWLIVSRFRYLIIPLFILFISLYHNAILDKISVLFEVIISRYDNSADLFSFIASGRYGFVDNAFDIFYGSEPSILRYIIGMGSFVSYQNVDSLYVTYDTLETDFFDIFFMYGIFGVISYIGLYIYIYIYTKSNKVWVLSLSLLFMHSLIAGHVIFNGMSCVALLSIFILSKYLKEFYVVKKNI